MMSETKKGFFERVYQIVAQIPSGKVITYGQIAFLLGSPHAARVVGYAMAAAPEWRGLPCHRVVNRRGELSREDIFGPGVQRGLLEREGIAFLPNGRIDLKKCIWSF